MGNAHGGGGGHSAGAWGGGPGGGMHSLPRDPVPTRLLPGLQDAACARLRSTDNGAILTAEGTIRGVRRAGSLRRYEDPPQQEFNGGIFRSRSIHATSRGSNNQDDTGMRQLPRVGGRTQQERYRQSGSGGFSAHAKRFGSEPDLRTPTSRQINNVTAATQEHRSLAEGFGNAAKNRISRGKKKYKAPAPPGGKGGEGSSPDSYHWELASGGETSDSAAPRPRLRLFKTRAETHKNGHQMASRDAPEMTSFHQQYRMRQQQREVGKDQSRGVSRERVTHSAERSIDSDINKNNIDARRIETDKRKPGLRNERSENWNEKVQIRNKDRQSDQISPKRSSAPPAMARALSAPDFQAELRAVTQKLRGIERRKQSVEPDNNSHSERIMKDNKSNVRQKPDKGNNKEPKVVKEEKPVKNDKRVEERNVHNKINHKNNFDSKESKMITMDHHNIPVKNQLINGYKKSVEKNQNQVSETRKISPYNQESYRPEQNGIKIKETTPEQPLKTPTKTFYFGMDSIDYRIPSDNFKVNVITRDTQQIIPGQNFDSSRIDSSSESALSSDGEGGDINGGPNTDIAMQLRPTLPKKQLEVPRFSPATAWRLLSILDTGNAVNGSLPDSEEGPVFMEDRIERLSRPGPALLIGQRSNNDKSGDSGISGDAGPPLLEDVAEPSPPLPPAKIQASHTRPQLTAWTPQQDLDEDVSSSDGGVESPKATIPTDVKYTARSQHVFSLSLPRESHLHMYNNNDKAHKNSQGFNSLQKLRRSLGVALGSRQKIDDENIQPEVDNNWFLSCSAPNSLNNNTSAPYKSKGNSDEEKSIEREPPTMLKTPSFTYLANGGHVMYLPSLERQNGAIQTKPNNDEDIVYRNKNRNEEHVRNNREQRLYKGKSSEIVMHNNKRNGLKNNSHFSKSCENITHEMRQLNRTPSPELKQEHGNAREAKQQSNNSNKNARFTFQSTVRRLERRRMGERLAKEAERREKQRLGELEAMRRVEEEFQRKRAREKANIRQQLRMFSMDNSEMSKIEDDWEHEQTRQDPDGAVSSPTSSPTNQTKAFIISSKKKVKDNRTPYVNKIVEQKMSQSDVKMTFDLNTENSGSEISSRKSRSKSYDHSDRHSDNSRSKVNKKDHRSSPARRSNDSSKNHSSEASSDYKNQTREYRDYRGIPRLSYENSTEQQTTVHPQVVYNMPKASQKYPPHELYPGEDSAAASPRSDNYRRDFARGTVPVTSSDSELSQSNTRSHSPPHLPRIRARSVSPDGNKNEDNTSMINCDNDMNDNNITKIRIRRNSTGSRHSNCDLNTIHIDTEDITAQPKLSFGVIQPLPFNLGKNYRPITFKIK